MNFYYLKNGRLRKIGVNLFLEMAINSNSLIKEISFNHITKELKVNRVIIKSFFKNILISENKMIIKL